MNDIEQIFAGYRTVTRAKSVKVLGLHHAIAHVDVAGDFGRETGFLDISTDQNGLITSIEADLD